ncbi:MAG: DUF3347 domain-containing protein [Leptospiraceae bacterium]|nr:DUF3347 domain-containing protein [Leptospiraceae bacterium]
MNTLKTIIVGITFLLVTNTFAEEEKSVQISEELVKFHDALMQEKPEKLNVSKLTSILSKGLKDKKDKEIYQKALPLAKKIGDAGNSQEKLDTYAAIVEILEPIVKGKNKSNANLFYCPMAKKKWMAKGDKIVNPYYKDMRDCGEKL